MSDIMFYGVLRMPYIMAMSDEISSLQFYQRVQECADRCEKAEAEVERLMQALANSNLALMQAQEVAQAANRQAEKAKFDRNQLRDKLTLALGLSTHPTIPFAWEYLIGLVEELAKYEDSAQAQAPVLPRTPEEAVAFIGPHFGSMDVEGPLESRQVRLSIHDLLSSFSDWQYFAPDAAPQQHAQAAQPMLYADTLGGAVIEVSEVAPAQPIAGELPPLPRRADYREGKTPEFTADQMRTYGHQCRAAALNDAATLIEQTQETHVVNGPNGQTNERTVTPRKAHNLMGLAYADAIRALNKTEG